MYLKSIEIQGFKSFANKILFEFHNGITGIVGPNGSGKSNVADAVRWVLGEQRAKQLRGESMQDVIFAGTENRKPLSYAYVAITLDNSDHQLAVDFEEVTVSRRVYRSGESEYLINGSTCRLKDVNELFYDTGIGKEGYSIIGQGQIERILSGRPEERRELFDEAAGIVKFKRRKVTAQKKLENERENLIRVTDILSEQEKQLEPLERQSETAKNYLNRKEELKKYEVNLFLLDNENTAREKKAVEEKYAIADNELKAAKEEYESTRSSYEKVEAQLEQLEEDMTAAREDISSFSVKKGQIEGQINVLKEQIHTAQLTGEHVESQRKSLTERKVKQEEDKQNFENQKKALLEERQTVTKEREAAQQKITEIETEISQYQQKIDQCKTDMIDLLNQNANIKAGQQRYDTMLEQINIRKAQLTQRLLQRKSDEADLDHVLMEYEEELKKVESSIQELVKSQREMEEKRFEWKQKYDEQAKKMELARGEYQRSQSRLESLRNIAERYDGYGNSIRKVMENKDRAPGIIGVVADLIQVDKRYETAVEIALGGGIRNIVTEDEDTAKQMIGFLKQNRYGRATFLPLTSVGKNSGFKNQDALGEEGVIGRANTLVKTEERFKGIMEYLLGRTIIVDTLEHATKLARKYRYTLHLVTLEGELLSPGGSMTGGAFKNNSNLLGRKREIDELTEESTRLKEQIETGKKRLADIDTARVLLKDDLEEVKDQLQQMYLQQNTAKMNRDRALEQKTESDNVYRTLQLENNEIEEQLQEIQENKDKIAVELQDAKQRETKIQEESRLNQEKLNGIRQVEREAKEALTSIQMKESGVQQKEGFFNENLSRIRQEIVRIENELEALKGNAKESLEDAENKQREIETLTQAIQRAQQDLVEKQNYLENCVKQKEEQNQKHKGFFEKREAISNHMSALDKEIFRLNSQREKLENDQENQTNYMWEEYELTLHAALELREEELNSRNDLKEKISKIKDEIRRMGDVNVNAIEDYKSLSERYNFLKNQHDDLVKAEQALMEIIEELDIGMRKQFTEKFAQIQSEFDKVFKELFGGGKGTLELVEDEDILECGIRIIAQPPGKKLQNMMQLSGGEKSLTAIALLFAIQNLKPSPFCLLDEIEAALDDSNVSRFAKYLGKLTRNTQFIVITHRRGSMAAADRLYGITMQEKGVSTLVSVNLIENDLDK